jgi:protein phosphatase
MALVLNVGKCTLLGNNPLRDKNEDAVDVKQFPDIAICTVADGMGGQQAGEIASRQAVEILPREIQNNLAGVRSDKEIPDIIRRAIVHANAVIIDMATMDREYQGMGTTVVLAVWPKKTGKLFVAGVGDSRVYQVSSKKIEQLTIDHSIAQALVEAKTISAVEARTHKYRNVLWKYLGTKEVGDGPEVKSMAPRAGDRLLLCTDGLCGVVPDEELRKFIAAHPNVQECADGLGQLALDSGSKDNVSCIVMEFKDGR